jgi:hypothetical protein
MISTMIISTVILMLIGLAVLFRAYTHAAEGYEDEYGFHPGSDPEGKTIRIPTVRAVMAHSAPKAAAVRAKRASTQGKRKMVDQGSTAPF